MSRSDLQAASWLHHMHVTCCNMHVTGLLQTMQDEIPTSYWGRLDRRWTIGAATGAGYIAFDVASAHRQQMHGHMAADWLARNPEVSSLQRLERDLVGRVVARAIGERGLPSFLCTPPKGL